MLLNNIILDDFFDDYPRVRSDIIEGGFQDIANPEDDVIYKDINPNIPQRVQAEIRRKIYLGTGMKPSFNYLFARMSKKGVRAPHPAHTDIIMGSYTLLIYFNEPPPNRAAGTSLLRHHETKKETHPETQEEFEIWKRDTHEYHKWDIVAHSTYKPNRAFIFRSDLYHRAEPLDGFGTTPEDSRIVICGFF